MGGAYHHIDDLRVGLHDLRQGIDDDFNALPRRQQAKGQDDLLPVHAELALVDFGIHQGDFRNTMMNPDNFLLLYMIDVAQKVH